MMSKKFLTRLLSFILGAGLVLQPVAAYAAEPAEGEEEEQITLEEAVDDAEILEEAPEEEIAVEEYEADVQSYDPKEAERQEDSNLSNLECSVYGNRLCYMRARGADMYILEAEGEGKNYYYEENDGVIDLDYHFRSLEFNSGTYACRFYGIKRDGGIVTKAVEFQYTYTAPYTYIRKFSATAHIQDYFNRRVQGCYIEKTSDPRLKLEFEGWTLEKPKGSPHYLWDKETQILPGTWYPKFKVSLEPSAKAKEPDLVFSELLRVTIDETEYTFFQRKTENGTVYQYYKGPSLTFDPVPIQNLRIVNNMVSWDHFNTPYQHTVWDYVVRIIYGDILYGGGKEEFITRNNSFYNVDKFLQEKNVDSGSYQIVVWARTRDEVVETLPTSIFYNYVKPKETISTLSVSSNEDEIIGYKKPVKDPDIVNDDKPQVSAGFGGWQEKIEGPQEQWETYDLGVFKTGTYRYLVTVNFDKNYEEDYALDPKLKLTVNGVEFTKIDDDDDEITFASPEITVDYPELTNVKFEGDVLSWDPVDDEDLWFYQINVGKHQKITSECSVDLKEICDALRYYGGIIPIELFAIAYEYKPITQVYSFDYEYDGPLPKDRTVISELTLQSSIKGMFREGYPNSNMLSAGNQFWIDCLEGWWEIYEDDEWSRYNEPTFGKGTYRYKNKISIDADYKDSYMLDPKLTLTVDKKEWFRCETEYDINDEVIYIVFVSPEYVLPLPEKAKITTISASCEDPSGYVIKDAEQALPELTNIDREEVDIKTAWVLYENGEPKQPEGNTFTPGEWHLAIAVLVKEDYEDIYELERTTTLTINGEEWTNVTGKGDPHYGVYFVSPGYVIEDDEPVEVTGTWHSKWGTTYFETEEGERLSGLHKIEGELYLFSANGTLQKNVFHEEGEKKYYFGSDGKAVKGWLSKWNATYRFDDEFVMMKGFADIDEDTYYFNDKGHLVKSGWIEEEGKKYYAKSDGKLAKSETIKRWGKKYSFDADGVLLP
ncbi:N-acetylmuramoyl-L-alanine amidase family protein [Butyrivibrio sp. MC2021]|uniref:N-acetylmuramoyl-L-alanine amidase family protein n=1 Tax=Butyrivibrio sp. MC2021 TaxID=1408306 RepID=UPI00047BF8CA|nr:hypothetical protein [Butyrivibrio sp. MC2021]